MNEGKKAAPAGNIPAVADAPGAKTPVIADYIPKPKVIGHEKIKTWAGKTKRIPIKEYKFPALSEMGITWQEKKLVKNDPDSMRIFLFSDGKAGNEKGLFPRDEEGAFLIKAWDSVRSFYLPGKDGSWHSLPPGVEEIRFKSPHSENENRFFSNGKITDEMGDHCKVNADGMFGTLEDSDPALPIVNGKPFTLARHIQPVGMPGITAHYLMEKTSISEAGEEITERMVVCKSGRLAKPKNEIKGPYIETELRRSYDDWGFFPRHADGSFQRAPGTELKFFPLPNGKFIASPNRKDWSLRYPMRAGAPDFSRPKRFFFPEMPREKPSFHLLEASGQISGWEGADEAERKINNIKVLWGPEAHQEYEPLSVWGEAEGGYIILSDGKGNVEVVHAESGELATYGGEDMWVGENEFTFTPKMIMEEGRHLDERYFFRKPKAQDGKVDSAMAFSEKNLPAPDSTQLREAGLREMGLNRSDVAWLENNQLVKRSNGEKVDSTRILPGIWNQPWAVELED